MKAKLLTILLLLFCCIGVNAQTPITNEAKKQQVISQINKVAASVKTISCDFTQTKHMKMLNDKMVSYGKMYYKQADKLRWEYTTPYTYTFLLNGSKVKLVNQKKRTDVIDTKSNKLFKEIASIMMSSVTGKSLSDNKVFSVAIADSKTHWIATLTPVKKDMKQMFSKIVLSFNKAESMVSEVNIYEKNNDRTQIQLKNVKVNTTLKDAIFSIN
jgi:outer membrane lipoprotein carrier protein